MNKEKDINTIEEKNNTSLLSADAPLDSSFYIPTLSDIKEVVGENFLTDEQNSTFDASATTDDKSEQTKTSNTESEKAEDVQQTEPEKVEEVQQKETSKSEQKTEVSETQSSQKPVEKAEKKSVQKAESSAENTSEFGPDNIYKKSETEEVKSVEEEDDDEYVVDPQTKEVENYQKDLQKRKETIDKFLNQYDKKYLEAIRKTDYYQERLAYWRNYYAQKRNELQNNIEKAIADKLARQEQIEQEKAYFASQAQVQSEQPATVSEQPKVANANATTYSTNVEVPADIKEPIKIISEEEIVEVANKLDEQNLEQDVVETKYQVSKIEEKVFAQPAQVKIAIAPNFVLINEQKPEEIKQIAHIANAPSKEDVEAANFVSVPAEFVDNIAKADYFTIQLDNAIEYTKNPIKYQTEEELAELKANVSKTVNKVLLKAFKDSIFDANENAKNVGYKYKANDTKRSNYFEKQFEIRRDLLGELQTSFNTIYGDNLRPKKSAVAKHQKTIDLHSKKADFETSADMIVENLRLYYVEGLGNYFTQQIVDEMVKQNELSAGVTKTSVKDLLKQMMQATNEQFNKQLKDSQTRKEAKISERAENCKKLDAEIKATTDATKKAELKSQLKKEYYNLEFLKLNNDLKNKQKEKMLAKNNVQFLMDLALNREVEAVLAKQRQGKVGEYVINQQIAEEMKVQITNVFDKNKTELVFKTTKKVEHQFTVQNSEVKNFVDMNNVDTSVAEQTNNSVEDFEPSFKGMPTNEPIEVIETVEPTIVDITNPIIVEKIDNVIEVQPEDVIELPQTEQKEDEFNFSNVSDEVKEVTNIDLSDLSDVTKLYSQSNDTFVSSDVEQEEKLDKAFVNNNVEYSKNYVKFSQETLSVDYTTADPTFSAQSGQNKKAKNDSVFVVRQDGKEMEIDIDKIFPSGEENEAYQRRITKIKRQLWDLQKTDGLTPEQIAENQEQYKKIMNDFMNESGEYYKVVKKFLEKNQAKKFDKSKKVEEENSLGF